MPGAPELHVHRQYEKKICFRTTWLSRGFYSRALLSLLKWWPQISKSSAALGFGFELLNSGERFRAMVALLFIRDLLP